MRPTPDPASTVASMKSELIAAGDGLADNPDVLRSVLAGCGDCIKILDLDGRLQFMSEGGKRVMQVEDFGALKGCPWPDFWAGAGNADRGGSIEDALDKIAALPLEAPPRPSNDWKIRLKKTLGPLAAVGVLASVIVAGCSALPTAGPTASDVKGQEVKDNLTRFDLVILPAAARRRCRVRPRERKGAHDRTRNRARGAPVT